MSEIIINRVRKLNLMDFDFPEPKRTKTVHIESSNEVIDSLDVNFNFENSQSNLNDTFLLENQNNSQIDINDTYLLENQNNFEHLQLAEIQEECIICMEQFNSSDLIDLHEDHFKMCSVCLTSQASALLRNRDLLPWKCPVCSEEISLNLLENYMEPKDYDKLIIRQMEISIGETVSCQDCDNTFLIPDDYQDNNIYCDICNNEIIIRKENEESNNENTNLLYQLADHLNWAQCPGCNELVEKNEGCNSMTHRGCNGRITYFCYECDELLDNNDFDSEGRDHFPNGSYGHCINTINGLTRINPNDNIDEQDNHNDGYSDEETDDEETDDEETNYDEYSDYDNNSQGNDNNGLHYCTICNYVGRENFSLQQHIRAKSHYERFYCNHCNYSSLNQTSLEQHINDTGHF